MPKIHYSRVIEEDPQELKELERYHRYTHLFQRLRMLRLLKSEECRNLGEAAEALGYSWRQCQRWFKSYSEGGLQELLKSRVGERGGIEYAHPDGVGQLLRRRKGKLKTGRPRHEEADQKEQQAFKKSLPVRSSGRALATTNR